MGGVKNSKSLRKPTQKGGVTGKVLKQGSILGVGRSNCGLKGEGTNWGRKEAERGSVCQEGSKKGCRE